MQEALPSDVAALDALELLVVVDNETDTLSSVDQGVPQIPEIFSLVARLPSIRVAGGHEAKEPFNHLCCACHGFSVLATARRGDKARSILFDVGPYPDVWLDNARRLAIDLARIELVFLSHWHFDHSGGIPKVVEVISRARAAAGLDPVIVDVHPDRPDQRGVQTPAGLMVLLPEEPTFAAITAAGGRVAKESDAHILSEGMFFASGAIERVTEYETGLAGHHSFSGDEVRPDPLIMDERYVAASVRGRGLTVLSACSHAGVVNACLDAKRHFPDHRIDTVLGGYHLAGNAVEERIAPTVRDLESRISPRIVAPGHCTGWRAKAALAHTFAPGHYAPSVVGSLYRLVAE
jgi:7,8-dihydropterin-6-yl-methyl-4-(beta-D-ribofuranosyl)aminobenzene 5'-phosphate synthase